MVSTKGSIEKHNMTMSVILELLHGVRWRFWRSRRDVGQIGAWYKRRSGRAGLPDASQWAADMLKERRYYWSQGALRKADRRGDWDFCRKVGAVRIGEICSLRESSILAVRFGLAGDHQMWTLEAVGAEFGLSRARVGQIVVGAMRKLRDADES